MRLGVRDEVRGEGLGFGGGGVKGAGGSDSGAGVRDECLKFGFGFSRRNVR
jgi:hypothetical protein